MTRTRNNFKRSPRSILNIIIIILFSHVSPFAAVFLCVVAGLAETSPSFPASGPFLPDVLGFQVPPGSIFPPQLWSSSETLPLHLHFCNCSDVLCFISSFGVAKPFQPSPSHNHWFHLCFLQYILIPPVFYQAHPIDHRTILISVVVFHL